VYNPPSSPSKQPGHDEPGVPGEAAVHPAQETLPPPDVRLHCQQSGELRPVRPFQGENQREPRALENKVRARMKTRGGWVVQGPYLGIPLHPPMQRNH
jgi:hypothetical protein